MKKGFKKHMCDDDGEYYPPKPEADLGEVEDDSGREIPEEKLFFTGSIGQAAALACTYPLITTRLNPNPLKSGQVQFGFEQSTMLEDSAKAYFTHSLFVDALMYWDKVYELKNLKYNLTKIN